jgi:[ribosomal protein S18]-alanine N-acetyltransferase
MICVQLPSVQLRAVGTRGNSISVNVLRLQPLTAPLLPSAVELDQLALGGLWTQEGYRREMDSPNSDLLILTPDHSSHHPPPLIALGCLWAILEEAHITVLAVRPQYQRQGVGQAILVALLEAAHLRRLEWATLEVRPSNHAAIALYQKYGFSEVGRRRHYYADTGEDALILWRKGLHYPEFAGTLTQWNQEVRDRLEKSGWLLADTLDG